MQECAKVGISLGMKQEKGGKSDFLRFFSPNHLQYHVKVVILQRENNAIVAQLVEHWLPKPRVAGSSPVYRSYLIVSEKLKIQVT